VVGQLKPGLVEGIAHRPKGESRGVKAPPLVFRGDCPVLGFQIKPHERTNDGADLIACGADA
jgi:hypothetical protein